MISVLQILAWSSLAALIYIYIGYPLLLLFLQFLVSDKKIDKDPTARPFVTLIISCFNEEDVIEEKLKNSLAIEYPKDLLEIVVVSDASSDRTDEIVTSFNCSQVRLIRQAERLGKTLGLNLGVAAAQGEIIVFSDANAMYEPDSILRLIENFADERVGYVVGEARYKNSEETSAGRSEDAYWKYEIVIKTLESRLHSVVGGDGAIYAIRRELYEDMRKTDINDFVNPLQIIAKGFRGIYAPQAICWEKTAGVYSKEFARKVRIVNRSFSGLLRVKGVLNPLHTGFFALEVISHKLLRWFTPIFMMVFVIASLGLASEGELFFQYITFITLLFGWFAYGGYLFSNSNKELPLFHYPYYFILVNIASLVGLSRSLRGNVQSTWNPPRLGTDKQPGLDRGRVMIHGLAWTSFIVVLLWAVGPIYITYWPAKLAWLFSLFVLLYIYIGYPLVLAAIAKSFSQPIMRDENYTPDVTMLICAYNEEDVIEEKVQNCLSLNYPPERIKFIIASDGSEDLTSKIVQKHTSSRVILYDYQNRQGKIGVILATVPKIDTDIILFSDANTMYMPDAVKKLVRNFADPSVGGVSANVILTNEKTTFGESESLYYRYERWIQHTESKIGSIIGADGGMFAIRRDLFLAPSNNIILDDFVISMNIALQGYRLIYEGEAIGCENNISSSLIEFLKKSRVVAGAFQAIKQGEGIPDFKKGLLFFCYFSHKFLRWNAPLFLISLLGLTVLLYLLTANLFIEIALILQVIFYGLATTAGIIPGRIKTPLLYVPFYFCLVNSAALYGMYKGIFNKQATRWRVFSRVAK
ncbi:glycosyltransferase family 2 protein [Desulforhopalus sp. IMCC35007]|uniref:glycosyltransferase family 2 protein n=1 Tax=Desulforhopalus sp. IMCC35007 TaxID=2569543 RepID=UPI0010ADFFF6|nr:glycosyltransferase family 2 protein [Desulforhopalus sp. IMCC35007]TKB07423.1 glycosyltransferase family 2 protein [Desulforhopalus sp. IMCC35007]